MESTIKCRTRGIIKESTLFYDRKTICKLCVNISRKNRENLTEHGFFSNLLGTAGTSARKRRENGREIAGEFSITIENLQNKYKTQDGKCYYSDITLSLKQFSNWQCSLERLNPELGYTKENIVLIACEFQGASQWSSCKYIEFEYLIKINSHILTIDWNEKKQVYLQKKR